MAIKEAEQEAVRKKKEALLLKQEADEDDIAERMKDFEENTSVAGKADNIMMELKPRIKDKDSPDKETKFRVNKVKDWLTKTKLEEEPDVSLYSPAILWFEVKVIATEFLSLPNDR